MANAGQDLTIRHIAYIHNFARTFAQQKYWSARRPEFQGCQSALQIVEVLMAWQSIHPKYRWDIQQHVRGLKDPAIGKLAACGQGHDPSSTGRPSGVLLEEVGRYDFEPFNLGYSGSHLMLHLATYAIIAAMADNFWSDLRKLRRDQTNAVIEQAMDSPDME
jgi:hypothetical protein